MTVRTNHAPDVVRKYYDQHRLSPEHKRVLDAFEEHKSYEGVAAALSIAVGTVKSRLNRARNRLEAEIAADAASPDSVRLDGCAL